MSAAGPALWRSIGLRLAAPFLRQTAIGELTPLRRWAQSGQLLPPQPCKPVGSLGSQIRWKSVSVAATQKVRKAISRTKKPPPPSDPTQLRKISPGELRTIFSKDLSAEKGDKILQQLHSQRVSGTLDEGLPEELENNVEEALAWLRLNVPWDEDASINARLDREEEQERSTLVARAEKLGLYKSQVTADDIIGEPLPRPEDAPLTYTPQQDTTRNNKQGRSFFQDLRERNLKRQEEEAKAKKEDEEKAQPEAIRTGLPATLGTERIAEISRRRAGNARWREKKVEEAQSTFGTAEGKWPNLTRAQRLWPSAMMTLTVVGLSLVFAKVYTPPPKEGRIWPEWSPASTTVGVLIAMNVLVFLAWRVVPLQGLMFKHFMSVPGYPRATGIIGNTFSHQWLGHLTANMVWIWILGTSLHEDVGRGAFLATYFSTAAISSFFSLSIHVFQAAFATGCLGASGIACGLVATWCVINKDNAIKIWGIPAETTEKLPTLGILAVLVILEVVALRRGTLAIPFQGTDFLAHLGGYGGGIIAGTAILWSQREAKRKDGKVQFPPVRKAAL